MARDTRPYIVITNELVRHPKYRRLSPEGRCALIELWVHCNEFMTDGHVDSWVFEDYPESVREQLLAARWIYRKPVAGATGVREPSDGDSDGYEMHDYLEHQKSKKEILEHRSHKSSAGALGNHTRHHVQKGIHKAGCSYCENPDAT